MKKILEIGPGRQPLHHRHGKALSGLEAEDRALVLTEGEDYTALDQPRVDFRHRVWEIARLERMGYTMLGGELQDYTYNTKIQGHRGAYRVMVFKKPSAQV